VTMLIVPFVTCSARSTIVLAIAGRYLGAAWVVGLYALSVAVSMAVSIVLSRWTRHPPLGLIMEVPPLRRPHPAIVVRKVWLRLREFFVVAWPVIMASSIVLSAATHFGIDAPVNRALSPVTTSILGLPAVTGIALLLGVFRKELTLVMLAAALGTSDFGAVLSPGQLLVLVVFSMLYVPCIATLATIWKEGGWKACLASMALNLGVSLAVAGAVARLAV